MTPLPCMNSIFLSTSSARRTTYRGFLHSPGLNISIHVLRKEDDDFQFFQHRQRRISIHVLREEDDERERTK